MQHGGKPAPVIFKCLVANSIDSESTSSFSKIIKWASMSKVYVPFSGKNGVQTIHRLLRYLFNSPLCPQLWKQCCKSKNGGGGRVKRQHKEVKNVVNNACSSAKQRLHLSFIQGKVNALPRSTSGKFAVGTKGQTCCSFSCCLHFTLLLICRGGETFIS